MTKRLPSTESVDGRTANIDRVDTLTRVLRFRGHTVIPQNHIGDWGTPFGMLIEQLVDLRQEGSAGALAPSALGDFYRAARVKFDTDPGFADRARARGARARGGRPAG